MGQWSVTLTGSVHEDVEPDAAWEQVRAVLGGNAATFEQRIRQRLPVSFRVSEEATAQRQWQALHECGVDAEVLADDGSRWWVRLDERSCGPVSSAWARRMFEQGQWDAHTLVCPEGQSRWQPLSDVVGSVNDVPAAPPLLDSAAPGSAPDTAAAADGGVAPDTPLENRVGAEMPPHLEAPGLHAGFWVRFAAYLVDSAIISVVSIVLLVILGVVMTVSIGDSAGMFFAIALFELLAMVGVWLYFAWFESSSYQATPGKMALGLRVTDLCGEPIGFGRATGRFFGKVVSGMILDIGYMMAGWTLRKQALHDMLASCCVVRTAALQSWRQDGQCSNMPAARIPGWGVVLIILGGLFMLAVPLFAFLAAISVPAYQSYLVRAQVAEGVSLVQQPQRAVSEYFAARGRLPTDNRAVGLPSPASMGGKYVSALTVKNGYIVVTFDDVNSSDKVRGEHLVFTPQRAHDTLTWKCASPDIDRRYLPVNCRD